MQYAAWYGCMLTPDKDGVTPRDSYARRARRGDPLAQLYYDGPRVPDRARYLWTWTQELRQGSQLNPMGGLAPIAWSSIEAWSRFTGHAPDREEVTLLFAVDAVLRNPPESITLTLDEVDDG